MSDCRMFKNLPKSRLLKQAARLNMIAGSAENAYKFGPKFTKMEIFLINQTPQKASIGLKQVWRQHLPTLKFHNEAFEFVLKRVNVANAEEAEKCPAKINLYDASNNKTELDCRYKSESEILQEILKVTGATAVKPEDIPKVEIKDKNESFTWA
ncbi:hypothetical protein CAAN1_16S01134 [[Candida] anglica]|uniref:Ribosomal protein/NADH dehydrogenase domain-containing protein n=1 Tax=[Candida] anglica TaxID=148631 RepID=A0ABP0EDU4_9ASCO